MKNTLILGLVDFQVSVNTNANHFYVLKPVRLRSQRLAKPYRGMGTPVKKQPLSGLYYGQSFLLTCVVDS